MPPFRIQSQFPSYRYAILEACDDLGSTWDLFCYPGIRSDSDLFTFGPSWYPWDQGSPIADGPSLPTSSGLQPADLVLTGVSSSTHEVRGCDWDSDDHTWSFTVGHDESTSTNTFGASFVVFATGYYDYRHPLDADIPNLNGFTEQIIHPLFGWKTSITLTRAR